MHTRPTLRWPSLLVALLAFIALRAGCADDGPAPRHPLLVLAPVNDPTSPSHDPGLDDALGVLVDTLGRMVGAPEVLRVTPAELSSALASGSGLVIVLDAAALGRSTPALDAADAVLAVPSEVPAFDDRFVLGVAREPAAHSNPFDLGPTRVVVDLSANTRLGRFYAVYELLRRLGARYYHPEDEHLPAVPADQVLARVETPTALGAGPVFTPDFVHRSFSFHGAHPLEHLESFSDSAHPIDEALAVNDWIIKNRGDLARGAGRGIAPPERRAARAAELETLRVRRVLRRATGITLHNQQHGGDADLDPHSPEPLADQVARIVAADLAAAPDVYAYGVHFGPTELTTTPDLETVALIDLAGQTALALRPDLQIEVNDHTTGSQPVDHYDDLGCPPGTNERGVSDYYDLAFHTDPRFAVRVHTVMFHPLEGPAGVYGQRSFAHKLCLMQQASAKGRPLVWFPESAYWLSWDNAVPVYLPLYTWTRGRDLQLLQPLLSKNGGTLRDHRLFNSGHEWGYWQADYAVGLWHWKSDLPLSAVLGELADPLCEPSAYLAGCPAKTAYVEVLTAVMDDQRQAFLTTPDFLGRPGGLYTYFAGEDPADEIGARSGLEFRPVRLAFRDVSTLTEAEAQRLDATDLAELARMDAAYSAWADRLEAQRDAVPVEGRRFLDEVLDGLRINALRARHTRALYRAVLGLRLHTPPDPGAESVTGPLAEARLALADAEAVIRRREAAYRYPAAQMYGEGPNGTTYAFRVHTKTHLLAYWRNRQMQVEDLLAGRARDPEALLLTPVFAAPGEPLGITWPALDGLTGTLSLEGGGPPVTLTVGDESEPLGAGIYRVTGLLETSSAPLPVSGGLARTNARATAGSGAFILNEPDSDLARTVLSSLVPPLRLALHGTRLALLAEPAGPDTASFSEAVVADLERSDERFESAPFDFALPIPDPSSGRVAVAVRLLGASLVGAPAAFETGGELELTGRLSVDDLVEALVELAGFEPRGATETLAGVLGFDPDAPPSDVAFRATLTVTPDP